MHIFLFYKIKPIVIIVIQIKIWPLMLWTALANEATDTFISVFGHAVAAGAVVVVVFVIFAITVVVAICSSSLLCDRSRYVFIEIIIIY